jgi:hypothetical protein
VHADAGLMMRDDLKRIGSSFSNMGVRENRQDKEWDCSWCAVRRDGDVFCSSRAKVGPDDCAADWDEMQVREVSMTELVFVGFAVGSTVENCHSFDGEGDAYEDCCEWKSCLSTGARCECIDC